MEVDTVVTLQAMNDVPAGSERLTMESSVPRTNGNLLAVSYDDNTGYFTKKGSWPRPNSL
jgi:hypothetical protein